MKKIMFSDSPPKQASKVSPLSVILAVQILHSLFSNDELDCDLRLLNFNGICISQIQASCDGGNTGHLTDCTKGLVAS